MIRTYENAAGFLAEAKELLLKREAVSQLLIANAICWKDRPCEPGCLFGTVWENGTIVAAFCNCEPYNLCIHAIGELREDNRSEEELAKVKEQLADAAEELAAYITEKEIPVRGINANGFLCEAFLKTYRDRKGRKAVKTLSMDIMECRALNEAALADGIYRAAEETDRDWILKGCMAFSREALHEEGNEEILLEKIDRFQIGEKRLRIFCLPDGSPVCMANRARNLEKGFVLNQVYTLPQYRGKGFAQTLIYKICAEFLQEGYEFGTLFVDKTNPVSNRVYEKVGFVILEDNYEYLFQ